MSEKPLLVPSDFAHWMFSDDCMIKVGLGGYATLVPDTGEIGTSTDNSCTNIIGTGADEPFIVEGGS